MPHIVETVEHLTALQKRVEDAAERAVKELLQAPEGGLELLKRIKFERIGQHPLEDRGLNLIEQVNQTFSLLTCFAALRILFGNFPGIDGFRLHPGAEPGCDIESLKPGLIAAEVFAAVSITNNNKLQKDIKKVAATRAAHRYVFFHVPGYTDGRQIQLETLEGIEIWAVTPVLRSGADSSSRIQAVHHSDGRSAAN
jgi:hypothetical protein